MDNQIKVFDNSDFGEIRTIVVNDEIWFVGKDVAVALGYSNPSKAVINHVDDEDKRFEMVPVSDSQNGNLVKTAFINESGMYSLVLSSKLPKAKEFKRWVTKEILPSVRKHGGYIINQEQMTDKELLAKAVIVSQSVIAERDKRITQLQAENECQRQIIEDFKPIKQYVDIILDSKESLAITQIAKDYDLTAYQLNNILHDEGIQYKVNNQWVLYREHMGKGYTDSKTHSWTSNDGQVGTKVHTYWTQKGRLLIHKILEKRGIKPLMDIEEA